jgi:hypothetical protein
METLIPEGLHRQPAATIASWIAAQGFNCVRLTYAVDMALAPTTLLRDSFPAAANAASVPVADLEKLYSELVTINPELGAAQSTVLDAFTLVIKALSAAKLMVILDNHVSRATWCCGNKDGNGWFDADGDSHPNSKDFNVENWIKGLTAMATYGKDFGNVVGLSLRNELRPVHEQKSDSGALYADLMRRAARSVHAANPAALIVFGGLDYSTQFGWLKNYPLDFSDFPNRVVMEFHNYPYFGWGGDCGGMVKDMGKDAGFVLEQDRPYTAPLWLGEFGYAQDGSASRQDLAWMKCMSDYMVGNDADWAVWAVQGSYYVREGKVDPEETWGMLDKSWSTWRNKDFAASLGGMWNVTQGPSPVASA